MNVVERVVAGVDSLARLGRPERWSAALVVPGEGRDEVRCPIREAMVDVADCRSCDRLVGIRSLVDGGGSVQVVRCGDAVTAA